MIHEYHPGLIVRDDATALIHKTIIKLGNMHGAVSPAAMDELEELCAEVGDLPSGTPAAAPPAEATPPSWRCFHCGETFTDHACAEAHFGLREIETPACLLAAQDGGLVEIIRKQEAELDRFRREDTPSYREFYSLGAEHFQAVRRAEGDGYARGLRDVEAGKVEPAHAAQIVAALSPRAPEMRALLQEMEKALDAALSIVELPGHRPDWDWLREVRAKARALLEGTP